MADSLLIVEDETTLRESLQRVFRKAGYQVTTAANAEEGLALVDKHYYDLILSDIMLPGMDGVEMLHHIRERVPEQLFVVMTAYASLETAVRALRIGAYDYVMKPLIHAELKKVVHNALSQRALGLENQRLRKQLGENSGDQVIGGDGSLAEIMEEINLTAGSGAGVLLLGETGVGKGFMARVIHQRGPRADKPFIPINCAAMPEQLLESELFGHARGAFTGAAGNKMGLLHEADGGTVFLDEIGDMPLQMQVKLLKVLEDGEIRAVGDNRVKQVDVRFITATNKDLPARIAEGLFREDLYYRINLITLELPPLRARRDEIPLLAEARLEAQAARRGKPVKRLAEETKALMMDYAWPGNIRELNNVLDRAALVCRDAEIGPHFLPKTIAPRLDQDTPLRLGDLTIDEYTRAVIQAYGDSLSETELAGRLGISRKALWEKRKRYALPRP